eukprot:1927692-Lingulodinium_polyedra.AAC.1
MEDAQFAVPVSGPLWELLHLKCPMAKVVATIKLLGDAPWTTLPCEQLRGSLAVFRRRCPDFGQLA